MLWDYLTQQKDREMQKSENLGGAETTYNKGF